MSTPRPFAFWIIVAFLSLSVILMLTGQTMAVFDYDLTVRLGLQEHVDEVGASGVQVNRAFGAADSLVYIPLMVISIVGLFHRRRWSLLTTAAVVGISFYWSATVSFVILFMHGVSGYNYVPDLDICAFIGVYLVFGILGIPYLVFRGDALLR
jgi:hypothetical protein